MIKNMLREVFFSGEDDAVAALAALCPACGFEHSFRVDLTGHGKWNKDVWDFDGNYDSPTFSPSMGSNLGKWDEHHPICHSFLRGGIWQFLSDSTHDMAGTNVPMVPPDPDMTWRQRHGWPSQEQLQHKDKHE